MKRAWRTFTTKGDEKNLPCEFHTEQFVHEKIGYLYRNDLYTIKTIISV